LLKIGQRWKIAKKTKLKKNIKNNETKNETKTKRIKEICTSAKPHGSYSIAQTIVTLV